MTSLISTANNYLKQESNTPLQQHSAEQEPNYRSSINLSSGISRDLTVVLKCGFHTYIKKFVVNVYAALWYNKLLPNKNRTTKFDKCFKTEHRAGISAS